MRRKKRRNAGNEEREEGRGKSSCCGRKREKNKKRAKRAIDVPESSSNHTRHDASRWDPSLLKCGGGRSVERMAERIIIWGVQRNWEHKKKKNAVHQAREWGEMGGSAGPDRKE